MASSVAQRAPARPAPARVEAKLLVVDDEQSMRDMLKIVLKRDGYDVQVAENGKRAIELLRRESFDLLLSDIQMPDANGVDVLRVAKDVNRDMVVFMMTAFASTDSAVEAMRLGAVDYLTKPFNVDELRLKVRQHLEARRLKEENVLLKKALHAQHGLSNVIGRSPAMLALFQMVGTIAKTNSTVLVTGESGPVRKWWRALSTRTRCAASIRSSRSTAARCPRRCSSPSSSAT